jgi:hypothetical protein
MPFYFKPAPSVPNTTIESSKTPGTVTAGDGGLETISGTTFVDVPLEVRNNTYKVSAHLDFFQIVDGLVNDLDLFLLDPDGKVVTSSTNSGGPEDLSAAITRSGHYTLRVDGFLAANCGFTLTSKQFEGTIASPAMQTIAGDFVNGQGKQVDFDGNININWTPAGGEEGFEIEQSSVDNPDWQFVADVSAGTTNYGFTGLSNGPHSFRVRGIQPGQIGKYLTNPSNASNIIVDQRTQVDVTSRVSWPIVSQSLTAGVSQWDVVLHNDSTDTFLPLVDLNIIEIVSPSGSVSVFNADNGKNGTSVANAAAFSYSQKLGSDGQFTPDETTGARTMRFQNPRSEGFFFNVVATAYVGSGGGSAGANSSQQQSSSAPNSSGALDLTKITTVRRFTYNPITKSLTSQLISVK